MTLLTVDQLRDHISSELEASALQRLLDAAEEAIVVRAGTPGARVEVAGGGHPFLSLVRPASAITSITELVGTSTTTLDATDYFLRPGGYVIERLATGTNGRWNWWGRVTITYTPVDDTSTREMVQVDLCKLFLAENPGLVSETIGAWSQTFASSITWNATEEYEAILSRLDNHTGLLVVGGGW